MMRDSLLKINAACDIYILLFQKLNYHAEITVNDGYSVTAWALIPQGSYVDIYSLRMSQLFCQSDQKND
jgi:hypothetical protein